MSQDCSNPKHSIPCSQHPLNLAKGALLYRQGRKSEALPLLEGSKEMMGPNPDPSIDSWIAEGLVLHSRGKHNAPVTSTRNSTLPILSLKDLADGLKSCGAEAAQSRPNSTKSVRAAFSPRVARVAHLPQPSMCKTIPAKISQSTSPSQQAHSIGLLRDLVSTLPNEMPKLVKFVEVWIKTRFSSLG